MIKRILLAFVLVYVAQVAWSSMPQPCHGWECDEVDCPKGYAVEVPGKGYLPCESFEKYVDGDDSVLLRGK